MTNLLLINASVRGDRSITRALGDAFVETWSAERPGDPVVHRDVGRDPPPFVDERWIAASFTPTSARTAEMRDALAVSDELIAELETADVIVLATPMYNYGLPTQLKAWVDQVIRVERTFSFDLARGDWPLAPVLGGKSLVLLTSSGEFGFAPGGVRSAMNHLDTHIDTLAGYLGVASTHHVAVEYQEFGDARHERSLSDARAAVPTLARALAARLPTNRPLSLHGVPA